MQERYKNILIAIICNIAPTCKIYLFGSQARGTQGACSDIDLALDNGTPLKKSMLGSIKDAIEESTIPYFVDVVDLHNVSDQMKQNILKEKVEWTH